MIWRDMIVFYEGMEASDPRRTGGGGFSEITRAARPSSQESLMAGIVAMLPWWRSSVQFRRSDDPMSIEYSRNVRETDSYVAVYRQITERKTLKPHAALVRSRQSKHDAFAPRLFFLQEAR